MIMPNDNSVTGAVGVAGRADRSHICRQVCPLKRGLVHNLIAFRS